MNIVLKFLGGLAAILAVFACAVILFTFTPLSSTPPGQAVHDFIGFGTNSAANAAIDASGVKVKAEDALRTNASSIAEKTGLSESQVNDAIDSLNIKSWSVTNLPHDAKESGKQEVTYGGISAEVTTYDDPSYITVEAEGQTFTLSVPDSSQQYLSFLSYL